MNIYERIEWKTKTKFSNESKHKKIIMNVILLKVIAQL